MSAPACLSVRLLPVRLRVLSACAGAALLAACSSSASSGAGSVDSSAAAASASGTASSASSASSSTSSAPASSTAASTGSATGNGALPAATLAAAAKKALITATSFHLRGSGLSDGKPMVFDIHYGKTSSDGYVTFQGAKVSLRYVQPRVYLRGVPAFWQLIASSDKTLSAAQKRALIARLSNKWVRVPSGSSGLAELSSIAIRTQFQKQAAGDDSGGGPFTKGPAKTFGTTRTVSFVDGSDQSTIYVAATGVPYPREISAPKDHTNFDLTDWNVPFSAAVPPPSQTINLPG